VHVWIGAERVEVLARYLCIAVLWKTTIAPCCQGELTKEAGLMHLEQKPTSKGGCQQELV
jgi:hypothetical protein